jgi:hypothetical protein
VKAGYGFEDKFIVLREQRFSKQLHCSKCCFNNRPCLYCSPQQGITRDSKLGDTWNIREVTNPDIGSIFLMIYGAMADLRSSGIKVPW